MEDTQERTPSVLDRALVAFLRLDGEKLAWGALLVVATLSRLIGLGDRAINHDESLHAVYSWQLYDGRGYEHQPMMHGPLKFILTAVMYFLFGVNDWSARVEVALFGILMIGLLWMMRRWLGKVGAFCAAVMFTVSPALLYHSRYLRDEVMLVSLLVLMVISMFRYLETRSGKWLTWTAVSLGLAFLTMEASFIFGGVFGAFLVLALFSQLVRTPWPSTSNRPGFLIGLAVGLPAVVVGLTLLMFKINTAGIIVGGVGVAALVVAAVLAVLAWRSRLHAFAELDLIVLLITLVMPFLSAVVLKAAGWEISQFNNPGQITLEQVWKGFTVVGILFLMSVGIGWYWLRSRWLTAAGLFWAIEILFFTTFFTNGQGIGTGLIGSLGYWIDQQEVMRGGQPWYYFLMLVPLYEFLPFLLSIGAWIAWLAARARRAPSGVRRRRAKGAVGREPPPLLSLPTACRTLSRRSLASGRLAPGWCSPMLGRRCPGTSPISPPRSRFWARSGSVGCWPASTGEVSTARRSSG
jgi:hypothetical protein